MNKKVLIPIIIAVAVTILLYLASINGASIPPKKKAEQKDMPANGPMSGGKTVAPINIEEYINSIKKKLSPEKLSKLNAEESRLAAATDTDTKIASLEAISAFWLGEKNKMLGAKYINDAGLLENSEKKLTFATQLWEDALHHEEDEATRQWIGQASKTTLEQLLKTNPNNIPAKISLSSLYIEVLGQPMVGVQQLRDIVAQDSANLPANLLLGKMAVQSNQLDKAIQRGELILRYHKDNWTARVFMAEAYHRMGEKDKAIQLLNEAKKLNNNPAFIKDVDKYISMIQSGK